MLTPTLLQINATVNSGSVGRIAEQIGQAAKAEGWRSYIAYARHAQPSQSELLKIGSRPAIYFHGFQSRLFDNHGLASAAATRQFIRRLESVKPDLVHLHNIHGYYLHYPLLFAYLAAADVPVVWTLHDCWPFTGHCAHFSFAGCTKWQTLCHHCEQSRTYPASLFADRSERNYRDKLRAFTSLRQLTLVPVCRWMADLAGRSFLGNYPIRTIYNGVDTALFKPAPTREAVVARYHLRPDRFLVLGVANTWSPRKGLSDFMALRKILPATCHILLVGLSEREVARLPEGVTGISRTENVGQLAELYAAADLFLNPTWEDTFPTTNLEALACGTPVATYRTGGSIEAVDAATGFIVEQGDVQGLAAAIRTVQEKGKAAYTAAARRRALECFDKQDRYQEYIQLYKELLNPQIK